jgi:Superinfection immunity protein
MDSSQALPESGPQFYIWQDTAGIRDSRPIISFSLIACKNVTGAQMLNILLASALVLYAVPMMDAYDRAHPDAVAISLLNLFLGWTLIGWLAALAWARKESPVEFHVGRNKELFAARAR